MRIATYNVEWFDSLFDDAGQPLADDGWSARRDVTRADQLAALGIVFTALDADAIMVIEAPDTHARRDGVRALENFAKLMDLRAKKALIGFPNQTQQEISLLYDPYVIDARHDPIGLPEGGAGEAPRFDGQYRIDLDVDTRADRVVFSKPPLEVAMQVRGRDIRMIGAHLKSKAPHGATNRDEIMRLSISNRRKQLAQAIWLRERVAAHLNAGESVIVLGDLNDGPGLDEYEDLFGRSSVEIVMGEDGGPCLYDPNAARALSGKLAAQPTSARFYIGAEERYLQALLDYVMISPDLRTADPRWRIWHPFEDPVCYNTPELHDALLTASDHFPVSVDLAL
ncbi:endonuclease/exonuclease/phosphatase family protein [Mesobacterium pallidum]|uniref:endonuclease/exonuclease/phosphatase family protein n=1 Tax=Mesobacterium pallidum TaxID=2872037 RepID=UPI001EE2B37D